MSDISKLLDEIERRADAAKTNLDDEREHVLSVDVPALVKAVRYVDSEVIENLPSIAKRVFRDKVASILNAGKAKDL